MSNNAIIFTNGLLSDSSAKTAHGLIRGSDRFSINGVIDAAHAGQDAGEVIDGRTRGIPVFASLEEALQKSAAPVQYGIIGIAPKGGKLPVELQQVLEASLRNKIAIINGLHEFISDMPNMAALAKQQGVTITDIRKPKDRSELHFWTGKIYEVSCPIIAVLGVETNLGKRTTTRMLTETCRAQKIQAQMIFTGQTGWMQDGKCGFVLDTTVNDFVAGELEHAIHTCWRETNPPVIFLEGQSGLRNPTGPCGSEFLVSGNARKTILVFSPKREYFNDMEAWGKCPSVQEEIALIKMYGSEVIALVINTRGCTDAEAYLLSNRYEQLLGIPVLLPLHEGVDRLMPVIRSMIEN